MRNLIINRSKNMVTWIAGTIFLTIFLIHKPNYLNTNDLFFWIGFLSLPFSYKIRRDLKSSRFLWPAAGCGLISVIFPTTFLIYCGLIFCILFIIEQLEGRTNWLFVFHLLLLSPIFQYFDSIISFPIRLGLSNLAGNMLNFAGYEIHISGNLIKLDGVDFLVDSACSGLFMLRYSFLFAVIILAYFQTEKIGWNIKNLVLLFSALFILNIIGNLIRIIMLIVFKVMPDFWFHEFLGLIIFLIYSLLPFYFLSKFWSERKSAYPVYASHAKSLTLNKFLATYLAMLAIFSLACWNNSHRTQSDFHLDERLKSAYEVEKINDKVYKLRTANALVYLKPPVEPYHADHNPLICWKGSGYDFKHIGSGKVGDLEVSVAELIKGDDKLFTMWWFDSGKHKTNSQWDWRWRSLRKNENFYLVNITAESMSKLHEEAQLILNQKIIK